METHKLFMENHFCNHEDPTYFYLFYFFSIIQVTVLNLKK